MRIFRSCLFPFKFLYKIPFTVIFLPQFVGYLGMIIWSHGPFVYFYFFLHLHVNITTLAAMVKLSRVVNNKQLYCVFCRSLFDDQSFTSSIDESEQVLLRTYLTLQAKLMFQNLHQLSVKMVLEILKYMKCYWKLALSDWLIVFTRQHQHVQSCIQMKHTLNSIIICNI